MNQYYRNKCDVTSIEGVRVDEGSLWKFDINQNVLILEDEDQYASAKLDEQFQLSDF